MTATISDPPRRRTHSAPRLASNGSPPLHGRAAEWQAVGELLRRAKQGRGGVVLVDGERGIGKSLLLRACEREAMTRGFSLADGTADRLGQAIPLFALLTALRQPFGMDGSPPGGRPDSIAAQIAGLQQNLERRAAAAPVLVSLDELQWASQATLAALRILPGRLARYPLAWILARSDEGQDHGGDPLFTALECEGARRLTLGPLGDEAVTAVLTEAFGAPPDDRLLALAAGAGGNPMLLTELTSGLRDVKAVRVVDGRACLVSPDVPAQIHAVARNWLDGLSGRAQHALKTAAVLSGSFRLADLAEMLGDTPAGLLPAVEEAVDAGLVVAENTTFSFRHRLLRCAAAAMVLPPARSALHGQFGELLMRRGESAPAARHLLEAACTGDPASLAGLDKAAEELLPSSPRVAASLAVRALELTPPGDPGALPRSVTAAEVLTAAGRLHRATRIARDGLAQPLPSLAEARLRCALSSILAASGQPGPARAEAQAALAQPQLPPAVRDEALAAHLHALAGLGDGQAAEQIAAAILAAPAQHGSQAVTAALVTCAMSAWESGWISDGLRLLREAARTGSPVSPDARHEQPLLALAAALADLGHYDEAEAVLQAVDPEALDGIPAQAVLSILGARLCVARGSLNEADAAARAALTAAGAAASYAGLAHCLLSLIALRRGDLEAAAGHLASRPAPVPPTVAIYARSAATMIQARVTEACEGPAAAIRRVRGLYADLHGHIGLLLGEGATPAWLVRTALAAGDRDLAGEVARAAETVARENPAIAALNAAAAHCLGLLDSDPALLAGAAERHTDLWTQASALEDLGVLLASRADKAQAIPHLNEALDGYRQAGAAGDMARVRGRLRALGVRRRHWTPAPGRPVTGWESLTEAERATAGLAAQGLNNKQIAGRLYISRHTVAFHLRQIFLKLHIGSRVELTRIVIEHT